MKKYWLMMIGMMVLGGCDTSNSIFRPMPWILDQYPKDAPEDYVAGWKDGCESGLSSMTNDYYRTFYKFKSDPTQVKNSNYYIPWKDAYNYCRHYAYGPLREANLRTKLPTSPQGEFYNTPDSPTAGVFMQRMWSGEGSDNW